MKPPTPPTPPTPAPSLPQGEARRRLVRALATYLLQTRPPDRGDR